MMFIVCCDPLFVGGKLKLIYSGLVRVAFEKGAEKQQFTVLSSNASDHPQKYIYYTNCNHHSYLNLCSIRLTAY